ncbi:MAG: (deoxy)nucleoside triphosphate pyrophosphohydrolase [Nitrospirota bacterium]
MPPESPGPPPAVNIAAAVIENRGRYLIARRRDDAVLGGYWEFPGGKRRRDESIEDCVRREVREEMGVDIAVGEVIEHVVHHYPHGVMDITFLSGTLLRGEPVARGCAELRWVTPSELPAYRFPPANNALIRRLAGI